MNRQLSDEVREWTTNQRTIIIFDQKPLKIYNQFHNPLTTKRLSPHETWMWQVEDAFTYPLLSQQVRLVDRATIMRLAAADSGQQGSDVNPIAVKKVEIQALRKHADVFIEILVSKNPAKSGAYDFRATAKEVKTGLILANAISSRIQLTPQILTKVVATDEGYQYKTETVKVTTDEILQVLTSEVMRQLALRWDAPPPPQ